MVPAAGRTCGGGGGGRGRGRRRAREWRGAGKGEQRSPGVPQVRRARTSSAAAVPRGRTPRGRAPLAAEDVGGFEAGPINPAPTRPEVRGAVHEIMLVNTSKIRPRHRPRVDVPPRPFDAHAKAVCNRLPSARSGRAADAGLQGRGDRALIRRGAGRGPWGTAKCEGVGAGAGIQPRPNTHR